MVQTLKHRLSVTFKVL